jgi:enoyl-CoA hydratase/carnithine racemase
MELARADGGADHARFGMPETRFGIPSGMEASVFPKLVGWAKAELVLGRPHRRAGGHRIGYLQRLVPTQELDVTVEGGSIYLAQGSMP